MDSETAQACESLVLQWLLLQESVPFALLLQLLEYLDPPDFGGDSLLEIRLTLRRVLEDRNRPTQETLELLDIIKKNCQKITKLAELNLYPPPSLYHTVRGRPFGSEQALVSSSA